METLGVYRLLHVATECTRPHPLNAPCAAADRHQKPAPCPRSQSRLPASLPLRRSVAVARIGPMVALPSRFPSMLGSGWPFRPRRRISTSGRRRDRLWGHCRRDACVGPPLLPGRFFTNGQALLAALLVDALRS